MRATITITLKNGVLDPQGKASEITLHSLGFSGISNVRQGKVIMLDLDHTDRGTAHADVTQMCEKLLANTVIENYTIELE